LNRLCHSQCLGATSNYWVCVVDLSSANLYSILCIYCNRNILLYFCCTFSKTGTHWHVALTDTHCSWYTYLKKVTLSL